MKTYWDFEESERAAMSEDDVRRLLDFELMSKGVIRVEAPRLEVVEDVSLPKRTVYGIEAKDPRYYHQKKLLVAFDSAEDAAKFAALCVFEIVDDYETGTKFAAPLREPSIVPAEVTAEQDVMNARSLLKANKEKESHNTRAREAYDKACRTVEEATRDVWADWRRCRDVVERHKKVVATFDEYKRLTDGNADLACTFLGKAYPKTDVVAAFEWARIAPPSTIADLPVPTAQTAEPSRGRSDDVPF